MTNDPRDPKRDKADEANPDPAPDAGGKRSGRVAFDARGNSVWEWQLETGVYSRDVSTQKLKKLDLGELSIVETAIQPGPLELKDRQPASNEGFNPYNSAPTSKQSGFNPYDNARSLSNKIAPKSGGLPKDKPQDKPRSLDDLRRLSEWIKQKRKMGKD
jgi:hypothetical protein